MKLSNGANGKREPSGKVCDTEDASASFKSEAWKHLGFFMSREKRKSDKQPRNNMQTLSDYKLYTLTGLFFHIW